MSWKSQRQTLICFSSVESEFCAISDFLTWVSPQLDFLRLSNRTQMYISVWLRTPCIYFRTTTNAVIGGGMHPPRQKDKGRGPPTRGTASHLARSCLFSDSLQSLKRRRRRTPDTEAKVSEKCVPLFHIPKQVGIPKKAKQLGSRKKSHAQKLIQLG